MAKTYIMSTKWGMEMVRGASILARKAITILIFLFIIGFSFSAFAAYSPEIIQKTDAIVRINGETVYFDTQPVMIKDRLLVPARGVFERLGAQVIWNEENSTASIIKGDVAIRIKVEGKDAKIIEGPDTFDVQPILQNNRVLLPLRYVAETLNAYVQWDNDIRCAYIDSRDVEQTVSRGSEYGRYTVVIDPGHGGWETGASYEGVNEKDLNLDIALNLERLLKVEGIQVYMTRAEDYAVNLYARSELANRAGADIFVSIHNNAAYDRKTNGTMVLYYPGYAKSKGYMTSEKLASIIQGELVQRLNTVNLGIIPRTDLAVLRTTDMPAVLAEIGYMSNSKELSRLKSDEFRINAAEALKNGILKALRNMY